MKKKYLRLASLVLALLLMVSMFAPSASAANYTTNCRQYSTPSSSDFAYWNGYRVVRASGTTTSEVKWMQAALNYCIENEGLNATKLDVDGSFGPASKKTALAFQKAAGLEQDGSFGPSTIQKMKAVLNDGKATFKTTSVSTKTKILDINWGHIQKVGRQNVSGPCFCFALAYARTIIDGKVHYWYEYDKYGGGRGQSGSYANRNLANFNSRFETNKQAAFRDIYNNVKNGEPVVINVNGGRSTGEHFVTVVGYTGVTDPNNLSEANFLVIDSAGSSSSSPENLGSIGYKLKNNSGQGYYYCFKK